MSNISCGESSGLRFQLSYPNMLLSYLQTFVRRLRLIWQSIAFYTIISSLGLIFPLSCDHSRFSCFNVIQCILKSNEKHWCHDMTRLKWPYLSANTTVAPDKITNKIVYILSVQTLSKMASKVISNSRIPFSSTARKARYFGIKRLCDMVTWSFDRASLGCTRPWGFRYSPWNCLRLQHHQQKGKLFSVMHTFAYYSGNKLGSKHLDDILGPQPLFSSHIYVTTWNS